jgi:hypothetical protein
MTGESRKKKDAGQLRPASLTRHCARGDGQAQWGDQGSPRGISERSEILAYFFMLKVSTDVACCLYLCRRDLDQLL